MTEEKSLTGWPAVGIDLGTTNSCVAIMRNGAVEIISNDLGNRTMPSVVAFTDRERLIGEPATNQANTNPTNTIFGAKRLIGRVFEDETVQSDIKLWPFKVISDSNNKPLIQVTHEYETKTFSAEQISAMVLYKLKQTAESYLGEDVHHAVITCPAYFNDQQRQATKDAGAIAGLTVQRIMNEPTAASLAYGLEKVEEERKVLIFDLGGGTFDVSVVSIEDGVFEVLAVAGDTHLGGEDFDEKIVQYLLKTFERKHKIDLLAIEGENNERDRALRRLRAAAERAKCTLSASTKTAIEIDSFFDGKDFATDLTRARVEDLCTDFFETAMSYIDKVLKDAKIKDKTQIAEVVLVGGSTRIPKVQRLIKEYFNGKEPCKSINPDEAVAYGAAVQAAILSGKNFAECTDLLLMDVAPLSLGIEVNGNTMAKIIKRNHVVPCLKTKMFTTSADNQTSVPINIYEGERTRTADNHRLGQFNLEGIPPARRGQPQISVTFALDQNGILEVSAEDKLTKKKKQITITNDTGRLTPEEIADMVAQAEEFAEADELLAKQGEARVKAEQYADEVLTSCNDMKKVASEEDLSTMREGAQNLKQWLQRNASAETDEIEFEKSDLEAIVNPIMERLNKGGGSRGGGMGGMAGAMGDMGLDGDDSDGSLPELEDGEDGGMPEMYDPDDDGMPELEEGPDDGMPELDDPDDAGMPELDDPDDGPPELVEGMPELDDPDDEGPPELEDPEDGMPEMVD